jgi:hypothetical protein
MHSSETLGRGSTRSYHIGNTRTAKKIVGEKLCCVENSERSEKRTFQILHSVGRGERFLI